jgi:hypothetical protein
MSIEAFWFKHQRIGLKTWNYLVIGKDQDGIFELAQIDNGEFTWCFKPGKATGLTEKVIMEAFESWKKLDALGIDSEKTCCPRWGILNKSGL